MTEPKNPSIPTTHPNQSPSKSPASPAPEPLNPDPKSHPIHREVPVQPIHEGTDPKQPVRRGGT
jgi:hypothetical protein